MAVERDAAPGREEFDKDTGGHPPAVREGRADHLLRVRLDELAEGDLAHSGHVHPGEALDVAVRVGVAGGRHRPDPVLAPPAVLRRGQPAEPLGEPAALVEAVQRMVRELEGSMNRVEAEVPGHGALPRTGHAGPGLLVSSRGYDERATAAITPQTRSSPRGDHPPAAVT